MKFNANRKTLLDTLTLVASSVSTKSRVPAVRGVHVSVDKARNVATLTGSDLETTVQAETKIDAGSDGVAVLPARLLLDIVRSVDGDDVTFAVTGDNDEQVAISSGNAEFVVYAYAAADYPSDLCDAPTGHPISVDAAVLRNAVARVTPSAGTDAARPTLTGVLVERRDDSLRLVTTDSYRLAWCDVNVDAGIIDANAEEHTIIPAAALAQARSMFTLSDTVDVRRDDADGHTLSFTVEPDSGRVSLTTHLIVGSFPAYEQLIPTDYQHTATFDTHTLADTLRRVTVMRADRSPVRFAFTDGACDLTLVEQDRGKAAENVETRHNVDDGTTIAFNTEYVLDGLQAASAAQVTLEVGDATKPAVLKPVDDDTFGYLLMPVRLT